MSGTRRYRWHGRSDKERFELHIERSEGCWNWTGAINKNGYGSWWNGLTVETASRAAYQFFVGPIAPGLFVLHRCDNSRCVRPDHLYTGDHAQNMRDKVERNRAHGAVGERNTKAKLAEDDVLAIRFSAAPSRALAERFAVSMSTIQRIRGGKTWTHV